MKKKNRGRFLTHSLGKKKHWVKSVEGFSHSGESELKSLKGFGWQG